MEKPRYMPTQEMSTNVVLVTKRISDFPADTDSPTTWLVSSDDQHCGYVHHYPYTE